MGRKKCLLEIWESLESPGREPGKLKWNLDHNDKEKRAKQKHIEEETEKRK